MIPVFAPTILPGGAPIVYITSGLSVWYKFEDTTTTDSSGNGYTGTFGGSPAPTLGTGKIGQGAVFTGPSGKIAVPPAAVNVASASSSFSLMAWLNTSVPDTPIFGGRDSGNAIIDLVIGYNGADNGGTARASILIRATDASGLTWINGTSILNNSSFHHVATVYDGSVPSLKLYVDGSQEGSTATPAFSSGITLTTTGCNVGREDTQTWGTVGTIDDFRVYNRALSSTEISSIFNLTG